jgi:Kdo2-lipid IVA lauroyltransferase/acyltransferase
MQLLIYILVYPILIMISVLPFRLLYLLSDFTYFLIYKIIGYRKKVVRQNLALALPHLSQQERLVIEKKSYKHLCDMFLEMAKTLSITDKEIKKRFKFVNLDEYLKMESDGKSIALMCAHYASYEWVISLNKQIDFDGYAIYKPLANKYFDQLVRKIRSRFNANLIGVRKISRLIKKNHQEHKKAIYGFAADQSPMIKKNTYWSNFMGQQVPVHVGAEAFSKKYDMAMVFLKVNKVKRGYYEAEFEILTKEPRNFDDFEITNLFLQKVENQIVEAPEYYLWTHRRWKHIGKNKL